MGKINVDKFKKKLKKIKKYLKKFEKLVASAKDIKPAKNEDQIKKLKKSIKKLKKKIDHSDDEDDDVQMFSEVTPGTLSLDEDGTYKYQPGKVETNIYVKDKRPFPFPTGNEGLLLDNGQLMTKTAFPSFLNQGFSNQGFIPDFMSRQTAAINSNNHSNESPEVPPVPAIAPVQLGGKKTKKQKGGSLTLSIEKDDTDENNKQIKEKLADLIEKAKQLAAKLNK